MLIASKNGDISVAKLIRQTNKAWTFEVERREFRVRKTDNYQRAFDNMSDALRWAGAASELIEHFVALEATKATSYTPNTTSRMSTRSTS